MGPIAHSSLLTSIDLFGVLLGDSLGEEPLGLARLAVAQPLDILQGARHHLVVRVGYWSSGEAAVRLFASNTYLWASFSMPRSTSCKDVAILGDLLG